MKRSRLSRFLSILKDLLTLVLGFAVLIKTLADIARPARREARERQAPSEDASARTAAEQAAENQKAPEVESPERRRLLALIGLGAAGASATMVGLPITVFIIAPALREGEGVWRDVGLASSFPVNQTTKVVFLDPSPLPWSGPAAMSAAWLNRLSQDEFLAFKVNCTHLGCTVRWEPGPRFFMCPCHGGVFFEDGSVAAGPPKEALHRYATRVRDGRVEIMTGPIPITGDPFDQAPE